MREQNRTYWKEKFNAEHGWKGNFFGECELQNHKQTERKLGTFLQ
jgi:hypothetical protein